MTITNKQHAEAIKDGTAQAVWDWMAAHDCSTPEIIQWGVREAMEKWLDEHSDAILDRIMAGSGNELLDENLDFTKVSP